MKRWIHKCPLWAPIQSIQNYKHSLWACIEKINTMAGNFRFMGAYWGPGDGSLGCRSVEQYPFVQIFGWSWLKNEQRLPFWLRFWALSLTMPYAPLCSSFTVSLSVMDWAFQNKAATTDVPGAKFFYDPPCVSNPQINFVWCGTSRRKRVGDRVLCSYAQFALDLYYARIRRFRPWEMSSFLVDELKNAQQASNIVARRQTHQKKESKPPTSLLGENLEIIGLLIASMIGVYKAE